MVKLLIYLKHNFGFLWDIAESFNGILFGMMYKRKLYHQAQKKLNIVSNNKYLYQLLSNRDINSLYDFFSRQDQEFFKYFDPHPYDHKTLSRLMKNPSFIMMGVFYKKELVGYFFLRCFINKHTFTGFGVDRKHQGNGIAKKMGRIMFEIAWPLGFRTFATASKDNHKALAAYRAINDFKILKELDNNYIFYEYLPEKAK